MIRSQIQRLIQGRFSQEVECQVLVQDYGQIAEQVRNWVSGQVHGQVYDQVWNQVQHQIFEHITA